MLVHPKCPSHPVSIFTTQSFQSTYICLLVGALLHSLLRALPVEELREVVVLSGFNTTAKDLVHLVEPVRLAPRAARVVAGLSASV